MKLLILLGIIFLSCDPMPAMAADPLSFCWGIPPGCPVGKHALCICPVSSMFGCSWQCVRSP